MRSSLLLLLADYSGVKVVKSAVKSDHRAIVPYTGAVKTIVGKSRRACEFRKHKWAQHVHVITCVSVPVYIVYTDGRGKPQDESDHLYGALMELLDNYHPERPVTITSAGPAVKSMLRQKVEVILIYQATKCRIASADLQLPTEVCINSSTPKG
jgi:hypothetical protein